jgi:hypothetical protein
MKERVGDERAHCSGFTRKAIIGNVVQYRLLINSKEGLNRALVPEVTTNAKGQFSFTHKTLPAGGQSNTTREFT